MSLHSAAAVFLFSEKSNSFSGRDESFPVHNRGRLANESTLLGESNLLRLNKEIKLFSHILGACSNNLTFGYEFLGLRLKPPCFCCLVGETFFQHSASCGFHPDVPPVSHPQQKAYMLTPLGCWQLHTSSKAF